MFNVAIRRPLTKDDYESIKWLSYYAADMVGYEESKILRVAEIMEEILEDESDALLYSKWIMNVANGKPFNWHKLQSFCIELMETYQE